jgi:hypothetical protein
MRSLLPARQRPSSTRSIDALDDCEKLYQCLQMTVDRSPKLTPIHKLFELLVEFQKAVNVAREDVGELLRKNDALLYADAFKAEGDPAETSGDDAIILYGPLLRSIGQQLRDLSGCLEPYATRLASVPQGPSPGRPRKYSLGFAILRLAQIYNRFGKGHPEPGVSLTMLPTVKYGGPFFRFAAGFLASVEGISKATTDQAFGRTVQDVLKVWTRDRNLHLLVRKEAQTNDIVKFVKRYDRLRAELGLVQQR